MSRADEIVDEWGGRLFEERRGRRGKGVPLARPSPNARAPDARGTLRRTVSRAPEVMVKITGNGKNMAQIRTSALYISRKGTVALEDERGDTHLGPDAAVDALATWAQGGEGVPSLGGQRRESFNIIVSMPADVDRPSVTRAARTFAAGEFGNHDYLMATHDDTEHPHVHLLVKASGHDGRRLNPRKADLQRWREGFAAALAEQGIEANATRRAARGVVKRPKAQALVHMERAAATGTRALPSRVLKQQQAEAARELASGTPRENPAGATIEQTRREVLTAYGRIARALTEGDREDRQLAVAVTVFVGAMEPVDATLHRGRVEQLRAAARPARTAEPDQDRER